MTELEEEMLSKYIDRLEAVTKRNEELFSSTILLQDMNTDEVISLRDLIQGNNSKGIEGINEKLSNISDRLKKIEIGIERRKWLLETIKKFLLSWKSFIAFIILALSAKWDVLYSWIKKLF